MIAVINEWLFTYPVYEVGNISKYGNSEKCRPSFFDCSSHFSASKWFSK